MIDIRVLKEEFVNAYRNGQDYAIFSENLLFEDRRGDSRIKVRYDKCKGCVLYTYEVEDREIKNFGFCVGSNRNYRKQKRIDALDLDKLEELFYASTRHEIW